MTSPKPALLLLALTLTLTSCTPAPASPGASASDPAASSSPTTQAPAPPAPEPTIEGVVSGDSSVHPTGLTLSVTDGELTELSVVGPDGVVPGDVVDGVWTATGPLALDTPYTARASARDANGELRSVSSGFRTLAPSAVMTADLDPYRVDTPVGVGMPVILKLSEPVPESKRQEFIDRLSVDALRDEPVEGAWRWFSDSELHYRTRDYWPANTDVRVQVRLADWEVGDGVWGGPDRDITFRVGDANLTTVDCDTHSMTTTINGEPGRTSPVSCGREDSDPSFVTRSGVHLVIEKHDEFVMDGATVGQDYRTEVNYATRISYSGEFVHGAPWSVGAQGSRNVSHGCVNVSDSDAKWFYEVAQRGDPVDVVGTNRPMELTNGYGHWTIPFEEWANS